jgi:hypothetical protein
MFGSKETKTPKWRPIKATIMGRVADFMWIGGIASGVGIFASIYSHTAEAGDNFKPVTDALASGAPVVALTSFGVTALATVLERVTPLGSSISVGISTAAGLAASFAVPAMIHGHEVPFTDNAITDPRAAGIVAEMAVTSVVQGAVLADTFDADEHYHSRH